MSDGEPITALPPVTEPPNRDELSLLTATNPQCISPSGPVRRVWSPSSVGANQISTTLTLPASTTITNLASGETAFVYSGGWSDMNKALDAGFQYNPVKGNWSPFFAVEGEAGLFFPGVTTNPNATVADVNAAPRLRLGGSSSPTNVKFEFWTTDTEMVIKISPVSGMLTWTDSATLLTVMDSNPRYVKYAVGVRSGVRSDPLDPNSDYAAVGSPISYGWTTAGTGQIIKVMTTIGQPTSGAGNTFPFTNGSGTTQFTGTSWSNTTFGKRDANGAVTQVVNSTTTAKATPCSYPPGVVVVSGSILTTETVSIKRVGAAVATFSKTSFVYRGGPNQTFNSTSADKVVVTNTGPSGSLLYICKRGTTGACNPTLADKYRTRNTQGLFTNKPIGSGGIASESLTVKTPANALPKCPANPNTATNANFVMEYKVDAGAVATQTIAVVLKCTSVSLAWQNGKSSFDGPNDGCVPPIALVAVNSNVTITPSNIRVKIDGALLDANNSFVGTTATPGVYLVAANNHCNYTVGSHTFTAEVTDPGDPTQLLGTVSSAFTITDNRWTMAIINATNNCPNNPGVVISTTTSAPGDASQVATNIPVGAVRAAQLRAGLTYTIVTTIAGVQTGSVQFIFPAVILASLPINFAPSSVGGINAYLEYYITLTCPGSRLSSPGAVIITPKYTSVPWNFGSGKP